MSKRPKSLPSPATDGPKIEKRPQKGRTPVAEPPYPPPEEITQARKKLLLWFSKHGRDFPWRQTRDPYAIWVSEVMLQQTTTAVVKEYFPRFMARFPTVRSLAQATETEVLKMWEGLGYYRRALCLHQAARAIMTSYGGEFPRDFEDLIRLPGIGRYTAGAILSLAFNQPVPIVETNSRRLFRRWLGIGPHETPQQENLLWKLAEDFLTPRCARTINLALMDLGHLICTPRRPVCGECPIREGCRTVRAGLSPHVPARRSQQVILRHEAALILESDESFWIIRRSKGRWRALWDFPRVLIAEGARVDAKSEPPESREIWGALARELPGWNRCGEKEVRYLCRIRHQVTRYRIFLDAFLFQGTPRDQVIQTPDTLEARWATWEELNELPTPAPTRRLIWRLEGILWATPGE